MALTSPGVQVSVIDESFYTPAEPGTVPMVFVATASKKTNAAGTGTAAGTLKANAGKPYLLTSQRELAETFGDPLFQIDNNNNPIHGSELNEYGLLSAYSLLGVSNSAFIVRADVDLDELQGSSTAPGANPAGTYWFDTEDSNYGIQQWNANAVNVTGGQTFTTKAPTIIVDTSKVVDYDGADYTPKASVGAIGDYAVVAVTTLNKIWYKNASGSWVEVGSDAWTASHATIKSTVANPTLSSPPANIVINNTAVSVGGNTITDVAASIQGLSIPGITAAAVDGFLEIYSDGSSNGAEDSTLGGPVIITGDATKLSDLGIVAGTYHPPSVQVSAHTSVPEFKSSDATPRPTGSIWVKTTTPNGGAKLVTKLWNAETLLWDTKATPMYDNNHAALYALDSTGGGANLAVGDLFAKTNVANDAQPLGTFTIYRRQTAGTTNVVGTAITAVSPGVGTNTFTLSSSNKGSAVLSSATTVSVTTTGSASGDAELIAAAITSASVANVCGNC